MSKKNKMKRGIGKRGQLTIFVIIALLIVSVILIYFLWLKPQYITPSSGQLSIQSCMEKAVKDGILSLSQTGGFRNPQLFTSYQDKKIGYLCYTNLYYKSCVMQVPFLKNNFQEQLKAEIQGEIYQCYDSSLSDLRSRGYEISEGKKDFSLSIDPGQVTVTLDAPVTLTRESSSRFTTFKATVNSKIYDILMVATSIVQQESRYGDSDTISMMIFYPGLGIQKIRREDGTTIYMVGNKDTKLQYYFATRSFAWPAGYGYDDINLMSEGDKG
jgi:hypothetical protein